MYIPAHDSENVQKALWEVFNAGIFNNGVQWIFFADSTGYALFSHSAGHFHFVEDTIPAEWIQIEKGLATRLPKTGIPVAKTINRFQSYIQTEMRANPEYKSLLLIGHSGDRLCRIFCCKYMARKKGTTEEFLKSLGIVPEGSKG